MTVNLLAQDIVSYHQRRWPDRPIKLVSSAWLITSSPGLQLMLLHRLIHGIYTKRQADARRQWLWRALLLPLALPKWVIQVGSKSEIPNDSQIDSGVFFADQGHIIFGAKKTGSGTVIGSCVTVGISLLDSGRPEIGRNVWIGPNCIAYGAISIGDGATLLPGTVLTKSIPAGVVMQGNPARLVSRNFNNADLRQGSDTENLLYLKANWGT
jgi:serine acetyltransferase